jgi:hypothetical protein
MVTIDSLVEKINSDSMDRQEIVDICKALFADVIEHFATLDDDMAKFIRGKIIIDKSVAE